MVELGVGHGSFDSTQAAILLANSDADDGMAFFAGHDSTLGVHVILSVRLPRTCHSILNGERRICVAVTW